MLSVLFALLFFLVILLQFNDVDALNWVLIYGLGLMASILFLLEKMRVLWALLLSGFYVLLSIYVWPDVFEGFSVEKGTMDNVERGREAVGLLIAASMLLILAWLLHERKKQVKNPNRTPS